MSKKKLETSQQPYLENYPALAAWIERHNGRCMWQKRIGDEALLHSMVECWFVQSGQLLILQLRSHGRGWDIFTSSSSNDVDKSLADAEKRLGLAPSQV